MDGYDSLSCDPLRHWSANIPTCTPLTCDTLSALENGNIALTDAIGTEDILSGFYGVTASYTCIQVITLRCPRVQAPKEAAKSVKRSCLIPGHGFVNPMVPGAIK